MLSWVEYEKFDNFGDRELEVRHANLIKCLSNLLGLKQLYRANMVCVNQCRL